jgi:protein ImuA
MAAKEVTGPEPPLKTRKPGARESMSPATPNAPLDQAAVLAALQARVARLEGAGRAQPDSAAIPVCDGLPLPSGGLARAAVHEVLAGSPGCAAAFCAVLLARTGGAVLWIISEWDGLLAWPPGLARCGLDPASLVIVRADRWTDGRWRKHCAARQ